MSALLDEVDERVFVVTPEGRLDFLNHAAASSRDTSPTGLGLGLYIVKQITVAHGGSVGVESSAEACTAFTMRLPREA